MCICFSVYVHSCTALAVIKFMSINVHCVVYLGNMYMYIKYFVKILGALCLQAFFCIFTIMPVTFEILQLATSKLAHVCIHYA